MSTLHKEEFTKVLSLLSPESRKSVSCNNWNEFSKRVSTFLTGEANWRLKPTILSPAVCSQYGWKCIGKDILQCVACNEVICGRLPLPWNTNVYDDCVNAILESLKSSHKNHCPWPLAPCPEYFGQMQPLDKTETYCEFVNRLESLLQVKKELPLIRDDILEILKITEKELKYLCQSAHIPLDVFSQSAVILALTGWSRNTKEKKHIWCCQCQRILNLSFYKPIKHDKNSYTHLETNRSFTCANSISNSNEEHSTQTKHSNSDNPKESKNENDAKPDCKDSCQPIDTNILCDDKNKEHEQTEDAEPPRKVSKISNEKGFYCFDPLYEHRHWCMWIRQGLMSSDVGWQIYVKCLLRSIDSPSTSFKYISKEEVKKVHEMLENWT